MNEKKTLRVLMMGSNLRAANGVASFQMNYLRALPREDVHFDFAVLDDIPSPYEEEIQARGGQIFLLPSLRHPLEHLRKCREILKNGHYDVVHDNTLMKSLPLMRAARRAGVPLRILHSHNAQLSENAAKRRLVKRLLPLLKRQCNRYFACSALAGECLFGGEDFAFIPNGIHTEDYAFDATVRAQVRREMGCEDKIVIATVARAAAQKNPLFAVDVFEAFLRRHPQAEYWWIGSGTMDDELAACVARKDLGGHIRLLGNRSDTPRLYQAMDAFLLPSLFEGLPVTAVEAQAAGLPCFLSDAITREAAFSPAVHYLPLADGPQAWAEAMERWMGDGPRSAPDCAAFNINNCARDLALLYRQALERR